MREEFWETFYPPGTTPGAPGIYVHLDLRDFPDAAIVRLRDEAQRLARDNRMRRHLVAEFAQHLFDICNARLSAPVGWAPFSGYLVRAAWGPNDTRETIELDREYLRGWAGTFLETEQNPEAQILWGDILNSLNQDIRGPLPPDPREQPQR